MKLAYQTTHYWRKIMRAVLGLLVLLWLGVANAGVIYKWETITGPTVSPLTGRVEITQTAYRAGQLDYFYDAGVRPTDDWGDPIIEDPTAPLIMFAFGFYNGDDNFQADPIGGGFTNRYRTSFTGYEDDTDTEANLTFESLLVGRLFGGGFGWYVDMQSDSSGIWTAALVLHDGRYLGGCEEGDLWLCETITGRWVLDASTVPTPGTLALALLSLCIVGYRLRGSLS
jgi:hypothetical protein